MTFVDLLVIALIIAILPFTVRLALSIVLLTFGLVLSLFCTAIELIMKDLKK